RPCACVSSDSSATRCRNTSAGSNWSTASPPSGSARAAIGKIAATTGSAGFEVRRSGNPVDEACKVPVDPRRPLRDGCQQRAFVLADRPVTPDAFGQPLRLPGVDNLGTAGLGLAGAVQRFPFGLVAGGSAIGFREGAHSPRRHPAEEPADPRLRFVEEGFM